MEVPGIISLAAFSQHGCSCLLIEILTLRSLGPLDEPSKTSKLATFVDHEYVWIRVKEYVFCNHMSHLDLV